MGGRRPRRRRPPVAVGRRAARHDACELRAGHRRTVAYGNASGGAAPCGALDLAGNVYEWTCDGVVRGGSYLNGPDELRCSARLPMHPAARDPYVGFRVVAVEPRRDFDWVEVPAGEYVIGRDAGEVRQRHVDVAAFELSRTPVTNGQYAASAETGARATLPAPDDHPVVFVDWERGVGLLRLGGWPAADRGRVGESSARHRRAHVSMGRRGGRGSRRDRRRPQARRDVARRFASRPARARTVSSHGRQRLGVDVHRVPAGRARRCAAARSRARASPGRAAPCAVTAGRSAARRTSASASREERR